jgi:hypothetical protein
MRSIRVLLALVGVCALSTVGVARATHNTDVHSANMSVIASYNDGGSMTGGTDIAFWENYAIFGHLSPGGFRILDISNPAAPVEVGQFDCNGSQSDVSVWEDLVFVSVDGARASDACNAATGTAWEGIRIVSIANPANPTQIATVRTDCGSHTHTLVPDLANNRILIYVLSYPLGEASATCSYATHRKISVVAVPLDAPTTASVVSTPNLSDSVIGGCHDVTVLLEKKLAGAACLTESQLWDITNPTQPVILSRIVNGAINIHHSTTFSWDGNTLVIGDELGGAAVAPGCVVDNQMSTTGALWFYDITNRTLPVPKSWFHIPQRDTGTVCSAHNFNTLPTTSNRDVLTTAWYSGASTVVDFTNPSSPVQLGHYIPKATGAGNSWSSYWYRDMIYANNRNTRGADIKRLDDATLAADALELSRLNAQTMEPRTPTAAAVHSLRAAVTPRGVVVRWSTGSEVQLAGFNVYRSRDGSKAKRLNRSLIRAKSAGAAAANRYAFSDHRYRGSATYHLELVGLDGRKVWFGTTTVRATWLSPWS